MGGGGGGGGGGGKKKGKGGEICRVQNIFRCHLGKEEAF